MLKFLRRRHAGTATTWFCEGCSEVCTPACRSQTRLDKSHTQATQQQYLVIR